MRDVVRVERPLDAPDAANGSPPHSRPAGRSDAASTSVDRAALDSLGALAEEVLPPLVARLAVSRLGELEVRHGGWHVRIRRAPLGVGADPAVSHGSAGGGGLDASGAADGAGSAHPRPSAPVHDHTVATSPAVGWFAPGPGLAVGTRLVQGDLIGWVDVLGVRQEVVTPVDGMVGRMLAGPGDPVEYGQELVQVVPSGVPGSAKDDPGVDEGAA